MKKLLLSLFLFSSVCLVKGQELGVRFGNFGNDSHAAVDGIFSMGEFSRIHADVSFGFGLGIDALYDFAFYSFPNVDNLYWYGGVGPFIRIHDPFYFGATGEIGLEYKFTEFPINVGLDWRPYLPIVQDFDFYAGGYGLNIRYVFGSK